MANKPKTTKATKATKTTAPTAGYPKHPVQGKVRKRIWNLRDEMLAYYKEGTQAANAHRIEAITTEIHNLQEQLQGEEP